MPAAIRVLTCGGAYGVLARMKKPMPRLDLSRGWRRMAVKDVEGAMRAHRHRGALYIVSEIYLTRPLEESKKSP